MVKNSVPEILRSNLSSVILQLLVLKINCLNFDFLDKPPKEVRFQIKLISRYIFFLN